MPKKIKCKNCKKELDPRGTKFVCRLEHPHYDKTNPLTEETFCNQKCAYLYYKKEQAKAKILYNSLDVT
jgi:hypothetical protein